MKPKLIICGIVLVALSLILFLIGPYVLDATSNDAKECKGCITIEDSITLQPFIQESVPIVIENDVGSIRILMGGASFLPSGIDFYLVDSSAFESLKPYLDSDSLMTNAVDLEDRGVIFIVKYQTSEYYWSFEKSPMATSSGLKSNGLIDKSLYSAGLDYIKKDTYHMIFKNNFNSTIRVLYSIDELPQPSIFSILGPSSFILIIIGIIMFFSCGIYLLVIGMSTSLYG